MSLPSYRKDHKDSEEAVPLWSADANRDEEAHPPAYPPRHDVGSSSGNVRHNVTYTFIPRWPITGSQQDALGVLGETKEETVEIVQRGLPVLAEYSPDRIEFLSPVELDAEGRVKDGRWGKILDETWPTFKHNPPTRLRIQVADLPGDEQRRERRNNWICVGVTLLIVSPLFAFAIFLIVMAHVD
ncbi:hypothetical protein IAU60_000007 [Kwoniella sp. DSM 27419]